ILFKAGRGYYQQEGDFDFHYRIIQGSGNRTLAKLLCDELYQLVRMYRIQFSTTPNRPHQAFAEHHRILDAIAERDGELAELPMRRHIAASKRNVERHFNSALENIPSKRGNAWLFHLPVSVSATPWPVNPRCRSSAPSTPAMHCWPSVPASRLSICPAAVLRLARWACRISASPTWTTY